MNIQSRSSIFRKLAGHGFGRPAKSQSGGSAGWVILVVALIVVACIYFYIKKDSNTLPNTNNGNNNGISTSTATSSNGTGGNNGNNGGTTSGNGQTGKTATKCGFTITSPTINGKAAFPLTVTGIVDTRNYAQLGCTWTLFEGQAGGVEVFAKLSNASGQAIDPWTLVGRMQPVPVYDWMANRAKPFSMQIKLDNLTNAQIMAIPEGTEMKLRFSEEDVKGDGDSDELELPFVYTKVGGAYDAAHNGQTTAIKLYFSDLEMVGTSDCSATYYVNRVIPKTSGVADASLRLLFKENLTQLASTYNGVTMANGVATVDFDSTALTYLNSAACMQSTFKSPIEQTLKQFPTIKQVQYSIDGKLFTMWDA